MMSHGLVSLLRFLTPLLIVGNFVQKKGKCKLISETCQVFSSLRLQAANRIASCIPKCLEVPDTPFPN